MIKITPNFDYSGWELSPDCLLKIQDILIQKETQKLDVVEFGSGKSTRVILDFIKENNIPGVLDSFDADPQFAHPQAKIREIVSCDGRPISFGNDYAFYKLEEGDLRSNSYDLVILDGHHGHGRSVAWKYLKDRLSVCCVVVIDDYDHYPFVEDFVNSFPNSVLMASKYLVNERWVIYEIVPK